MALSDKYVTDQMVFLNSNIQTLISNSGGNTPAVMLALKEKFNLTDDDIDVISYLYSDGPSAIFDIGYDLRNPLITSVISRLKKKQLVWVEGDQHEL